MVNADRVDSTPIGTEVAFFATRGSEPVEQRDRTRRVTSIPWRLGMPWFNSGGGVALEANPREEPLTRLVPRTCWDARRRKRVVPKGGGEGQVETGMRLRQSLLRAALAALLVFLLQAYAFQVFVVSSESMAPTLRPGDVVLVDRLTYEFASPKRGDLLVFRVPQADDRDFLKRVIGVPGDTVAERGGQIWVNGTPLTRSMRVAPTHVAVQSIPPVQVPAGRYFVLGDNPNASLDSRLWGTVGLHEVLGKALVICWSGGARWWDVCWHRIGRWLR